MKEKKLVTLFNKLSLPLMKYKWLYYLLSWTWGILMNIIGLFASLILIIARKKPLKFRNIWYFEVFDHWGGVSLGCVFIRDISSWDSVNYHEYGHTFQNAILGPFFLFVVAIPSAIRYWYQTIREKKGLENKPYDDIWFEGSATSIGEIVKEREL